MPRHPERDALNRPLARLRKAILACTGLPAAARIAAYNAATQALAALVADIAADPALAPRLVPIDRVRANDYNPNHVAAPELALLRRSIEADGVTMAIVTVRDPKTDTWVVVDGFHRRTVAAAMGRAHVPIVALDRPLAARMAATVRHNRARGKHDVELMGQLVRRLRAEGCEAAMADALGLTEEELLRLEQMIGAARLLASPEYGRAWGGRDGDLSLDDPADDSDR